jgi:hypothetical protein
MRTGWAPLLVVCLTLTVSGQAQDTPDPIFSTVPFEKWLAAGDHSQIPLRGEAALPVLSGFQRLRLTMNISVDGKEIAKRPAAGHLLMFLQFTDSARHIYQGHGEVDLKEMNKNIKEADLVYSHSLLMLPGDYQVAMAVYDTETGEHGLIRKTMRVPSLKEEPLPQAWQGLPPVEFLASVDAPDSWFQPLLKGRLHLPLETRDPVRIDLLMILPGDRAGDHHNRVMGTLISSLKTLSQIDARNGSLSAAILDLTRRRVSYQQPLAARTPALDWSRMSAALSDANPGVIDVGSLENSGKGVDFFLKEMGRRIQTTETKGSPRHVMVILAAPMEFEPGTDIHPIQLDENPGVELYYLRFHEAWERRPAVMPPPNRGGMGGRRNGGRLPPGEDPRLAHYPREGGDALAGTLKPLSPHLFDIKNPEEFRKALATMLEEIGRK